MEGREWHLGGAVPIPWRASWNTPLGRHRGAVAMDHAFLTCVLAIRVFSYMPQPSHVYATLSILEICLGGTATQSLTVLEPCIITVRGRRYKATECDFQLPNGLPHAQHRRIRVFPSHLWHFWNPYWLDKLQDFLTYVAGLSGETKSADRQGTSVKQVRLQKSEV